MPVGLRTIGPAHHDVERRPRWTLAEGPDEISGRSLSVRELVAMVPAPRRHHGQNEDPALEEQFLISVRIALSHLFRHMGEVEFDGPTATRLEVYEQSPVLRVEQVAGVRLAVQQLFGGTAVDDGSAPASQRVDEKLPVRVDQRRRMVAAGHESLSLCHSIGEVRRRDIDLPHAGMQPLERIGVVGR